MLGVKKNRMRLENMGKDDLSDKPQDTEEFEAYRESRIRNRSSYLPFVLLILVIVLIAVLFGIWYQFLRKEGAGPEIGKTDLFNEKIGSIDRFIEKSYVPDTSLNPGLAKCITLYRDRYVKKANSACEEFLSSPAADTDKSVALTVLGVILDEAGRYTQAIERLRKAVDYDSKNIYAYYDLALAYKHAGQYTEARNVIMKAKSMAPNDSRISLLAGNLLNETNDPKAAIEIYKEGISNSPDDPYLMYNLAISQYKQGQVADAVANFQRVIQVTGRSQVSEFAHAYLGTIFYHRDDLNNAEHHFKEAAAIKPNEGKYLYNLGLILLKQKRTEEAVSYLQKAIDSGSSDPAVFRFIAEAFEDLRMFDNATVALEKAMKIRPDDTDTMFQLADLYYSRGNLTSAEDLFRKIIKSTPGDTNTENALINLGIILDDMERYSEAVLAFEQALQLNPKNDNAYYNLGIAYKNSGQPTKAIENWKKAAALNPGEPKNMEAIGDYYMEAGFHQEAADEFSAIVKSSPGNYKARLKLADAYFRLKNYSNAEKTLLHILNNSKDGDEIKLAHRKLALVYAEGDEKNKSKAKDEAYRGSHMDPDVMDGRLTLARILMDTNSMMDREKAIEELTAVVRSDVKPKIAAQAYNYLGLCYYKNGEFKKAMREFQNSIDLDPSLTEAYSNKRAARAAYESSIQGRAEL